LPNSWPGITTLWSERRQRPDARLKRAIEAGEVSQVIEVAAGLSPRGWRFTRRYGEQLVYVEADLPGMAEHKRAALQRIGSLGERHRVSEIDVLRDDDGPGSLAAVAGELDPGQGLAIVTEGLLGYLPSDAVAAIWRRFATRLGGFAAGRYLSDLHLGGVVTLRSESSEWHCRRSCAVACTCTSPTRRRQNGRS
jgi:O-methyltransferase involved in polyketide biosynthesis